MSLAGLCLQRPVATTMLWLSVVVTGIVCWLQLPISALPRYETPVIEVEAKLPGGSPENMATSIATPLEKAFSALPGLIGTSSQSIQGETKIQLEFDPSRDIDVAAADVQAALFRVSRSLPAELPAPPTYTKINPGDAPILSVGLSSPTMTLGELNAYIDDLVVPALSTVSGVAQVQVTGRKRYAVRIRVDPKQLAALDLSLLEVGDALKAANSNAPLGQLDNEQQMLTVEMAGNLMKAVDFQTVIIATRQGQPIRLGDIASVQDSIESLQNTSEINGRNSVLLQIKRQPGANTVQTVDDIKAMLPRLKSQLPGSVHIQLMNDRSVSIRHAIFDVNLTLLLTVALVIVVIVAFLRHLVAALIPSISLPISLFGTFALMAGLGLSLNNISLMGLTIAVGLAVDDAIVVLENIMRHLEAGEKPLDAALRGAREVSFTVVSISLSLVAVFIPIFFMPGVIGLLFHEFAIVVSLAILVSAAVSLTLIPVLVPVLLRGGIPQRQAGRWSRGFEQGFAALLDVYRRSLEWALQHRPLMLVLGAATLLMTALLCLSAPKGFFPQEDIGQISAKVVTRQDMSYEGRLAVVRQLQPILMADPAVADIASKVDHDSTSFTIDLKPRGERESMARVLARMRANTSLLPGVRVNFSPVQNLKIGASASTGTYQYSLQSVGSERLDEWAAKLLVAMKESDVFVGLDSDFEQDGLQARLSIDRDKASSLGIDMQTLRSTLYAAFGMRQVSTIFAPQASYQVIMELDDAFRRDETSLMDVQVRSAAGQLVPLGAFATVTRGKGTMAVAHRSQLPAITFSFELADGYSLSDAETAIASAKLAIGLPNSMFGSFSGQAELFQKSQSAQIWLILIAIAVIYVVLGVLYESWIHPVTILLGVPSAAAGALLSLRLLGMELTFVAMIGVLLLIGIVKKNAIMMIDFALDTQRQHGTAAEEAIVQACLLRFRPIMMTTLCALMGALPLAMGIGAGAELRQPLGVTIVGGLLMSQLVTLFLTPVLYLSFDKFGQRWRLSPAATATTVSVG